MNFSIEPIAYAHNDFTDKFGIPRQSGLVSDAVTEIVFCEKFRDDNALRGLEGYSHIWLLWVFSDNNSKKDWSPTVRPPRLGGNKRMGVFSTRSPYHPNKIGLSCVKIKSIEKTSDRGTVIKVFGADLLNGTPIVDIKPYLTLSDCYPDAKCGFSDDVVNNDINVCFKTDTSVFDNTFIKTITEILKQDQRPGYQNDDDRIYAMSYSGYEIKFKANNEELEVIEICKSNGSEE